MLRLITVSFSHYCEKARWALDRAGLPYREDSHVPVLSWAYTFGAGGGRTVPCLVTPGRVLRDSTDILRWIDAQAPRPWLLPTDEAARWEERFDRDLGPHTRRVVYEKLLPRKGQARAVLTSAGQPWERAVMPLFFPLLKRLMVRGMNITAPAAARSRAKVDAVFADVAAALADGRRFLGGDVFTGADLTFAALAAPVLFPARWAALTTAGGPPPPDAQQVIDLYRAHPAGQFGLRLYAEERDGVARARAA